MWIECPNTEFLQLLLHGVLEEGTRHTGKCWLRFKDVIKQDFKNFNIEPVAWTVPSTDSASRRSKLHAICLYDTTSNIKKTTRKMTEMSPLLNEKTTHCHLWQTHTNTYTQLRLQCWTKNIKPAIIIFVGKFFKNMFLALFTLKKPDCVLKKY